MQHKLGRLVNTFKSDFSLILLYYLIFDINSSKDSSQEEMSSKLFLFFV